VEITLDPGAHHLTVIVNERPVLLHGHEVTGAQIKAAAVAQGVPIQQDFVLFEVKGHGHLKQIGDEEVVHLHEHEKFRAVAPDDNS
jgi:multiubiquitin